MKKSLFISQINRITIFISLFILYIGMILIFPSFAFAVPISPQWVEGSFWDVKFDNIYVDNKPIKNGHIDFLDRAFGYYSRHNGDKTGTEWDTAYLKAHTRVNTTNRYSSAGTYVEAKRNFKLGDAPNGWKVTLDTKLNGYLTIEDRYNPCGARPNPESRVYAGAGVYGESGHISVKYTGSNTKKDGEKTDNDPKTAWVDLPSGGEYTVTGYLEVYSFITECKWCVGPYAEANFFGLGSDGFSVSVTVEERPFTPPISAEVIGSKTPSAKQPPFMELTPEVQNGSFTITHGPFDPGHTKTIGDGINELTSWRFDFAEDPEFQCFPTSLPLASALLTLELTPKNSLIYNDIFRIDGLSPIPAFKGLPVGVLSTIQIELANFYRNMSLTHLLKAMNGSIPAFYADNAIVSFAELTLTSFPGEKVNDRFSDLGPEDVDTDFDATPCAENCVGTFTITAEFRNTSSDALSDLFFEVFGMTNGNVLCNADGGVPWGYGADLTVPMDGVLKPGDTFVVEFKIGLKSFDPFAFEVDLFGVEYSKSKTPHNL